MTKRKPGRTRKKPKDKGGRPPKKARPADIVLTARRLEALELRKAGYTYQQIGDWLEPPINASGAFKLVVAALDDINAASAELVEQVRAIELQRLDDMMVAPFTAAKNGDTRAIEAVLKIMDRRAQILGVDAPKKQEHSGPDGGPIPFTRVEVHVVDPAGGGVQDATLGGAVPAAGPV